MRLKLQFLLQMLLLFNICFFSSTLASSFNTEFQQTETILLEKGWTPNAVQRVLAVNAEWFTLLAQTYPHELERQQALLASLGEFPQLMPFIKQHPEAAALLAMVGQPEHIVKVLGKDACYPHITALFVQYATPLDAHALASALENQRNLICRLAQRGIVSSEALFLFPHAIQTQEYEQWLQETLELGLNGSNDTLSSLLNLLREQGEIIRTRMQQDNHFRRNFRTELWPRLKRVVEDMGYSYELFIHDKHLWDLLALPQGETILRKWALLGTWGLSPADLLFGAKAYPSKIQQHIINALLNGNESTLMALLQFGKAPLFIELVKRPIPTVTKNVAYGQLIAAQSNYVSKLKYFSSLSDIALRKELGESRNGIVVWLPGYSVYELLEKLSEGRHVSSLDVIFAAWEVMDLVIQVNRGISFSMHLLKPEASVFCQLDIGCDLETLIRKVMKDGKVSVKDIVLGGLDVADIPITLLTFSPKLSLLKSGSKRISKILLKQTTQSLSMQILQRMSQDMLKRLGSDMAEKLAYQLAKKVIQQALNEGLQAITKNAGQQLGKDLARHLSQETLNTWAQREIFKQMQRNLGNNAGKKIFYDITTLVQTTFKMLRPVLKRETFKRFTHLDARLFMRSDARILVTIEKKTLAVEIRDFFLNTLKQGATEYAVKFGQHRPLAWQKNLSAWWLINADGMADRM